MKVLADNIASYAETRPQKLAVYDFHHQQGWSYAELDALINATAEHMQEVLVDPKGKRVAAVMRNCVEFIAIHYAAIRIGAIFVPLNWRLNLNEIEMVLDDCEPACVYYQTEFKDLVENRTDKTNLIVLDDNFFRMTVNDTANSLVDPEQDAIILYTSGTTGKPKGVIITVNNALSASKNFVAVAGVTENSTFLCDNPMYHVIGLIAIVRTTLQLGGTLYVSHTFSPVDTVNHISDPKKSITHYFCVPQMTQMIRQAEGFSPEKFKNLVGLFVGGAPLSKELAKLWLDDGINIINGYGMSEVGTAIHMPFDNKSALREKALSIGFPAPFIEVSLRDTRGDRVKDGEMGEIWLRGPSVSRGYWNQEEATRESFVDAWYKTGDVAFQDTGGYYTIVDRLKNMYISGGENVFPAEVEKVIISLDGVKEVKVTSCPDEKWGEIGVAHIIADGKILLSEEAIINHCRKHLAAYKVPKRVEFISDISRVVSSKVPID